MGEEVHIEEFHTSSSHRRLTRMSTVTLKPTEKPRFSLPGSEKVTRRKKSNVQSTTQKPSLLFPEARPPNRSRLGSLDISVEPVFDPPFKAERKFSAKDTNEDSKAAPQELNRKPSPLLLGGSKFAAKAAELKERLDESLSPSPFTTVEGIESEKTLEEFVASAKRPFLTQFYGKDIALGSSKYWRKALKDHISHILQSICIIKSLSPIPAELLPKKRVTLLKPSDRSKTIVFDLDETLAHCVTDSLAYSQQLIQITLPSGETVKAGINLRPYAVECLNRLAKHFELIVFTASHKFYAEKVIELLDPDSKLFSHRLFRENCIKTENGLYIKDLRVLNRDLKSTLIVDNSVVSFAFQLDNGVPIIPYYDEKEDEELLKITDYLMTLKDVEDVKIQNKATFGIQKMYQLNVPSFLKYYCEEENNTDNSMDSFDSSFESFIGDTREGVYVGRKTKIIVENELGKLKEKFQLYLASEEVTEVGTSASNKE